MFAARAGRFREYSARVFERFWRHEFDVEDRDAIGRVLSEAGVEMRDFTRYVETDARRDLDACFDEAEGDKIFGVPTFIVGGEPFWGEDRIDWVVRKLDSMGLRR